ncbi:MAG TPA: tetratricopeptide repeat protein [Candidatus Eisenbacteria bacterium]
MSLAARQHQALGRDFFDRGLYQDAIRETEEAIALYPQFPDLHNQLGLALSLAGERERAVQAFRRALTLNPHYLEARLNLAIVYNDLGRYDEALAEFQAEGIRDPEHENLSPDVRTFLADSHALLGDTYRNLGMHVDATQEYRKALKLAPQYLDLKNKLGSVYGEMGLYEDAESELSSALAQNPRYADARVTLGLVFYRSGRRHRAREEWARCLAERADDVRARAYLEMLDREEAATGDASAR